jgi:hypothetical protein
VSAGAASSKLRGAEPGVPAGFRPAPPHPARDHTHPGGPQGGAGPRPGSRPPLGRVSEVAGVTEPGRNSAELWSPESEPNWERPPTALGAATFEPQRGDPAQASLSWQGYHPGAPGRWALPDIPPSVTQVPTLASSRHPGLPPPSVGGKSHLGHFFPGLLASHSGSLGSP